MLRTEIQEATEFCARLLWSMSLQLQVAAELRNRENFWLTILKRVVEKLVGSIDLSFNDSCARVQVDFYWFIETSLADTVHRRLMGETIRKSIKLWTQSECFTSKYAEEARRNSNLMEKRFEFTSSSVAENTAWKKNEECSTNKINWTILDVIWW